MQQTVDICLITWNRLPLTQRCIESVQRHTRHPYRLFVADNGSTDGTVEYLRRLHAQGTVHRLLLFERNVGVAPASNSLWELSDAPYYLKLDNDIEMLQPGWLTDMVGVHMRNREARLLAYSFQKQLYGVTYPVRVLSGGDEVQDPRPHNINGACVLVPRATHQELGFWCEDYAPYSDEDTDYSFRARFNDIPPLYMLRTDMMRHNYLASTSAHDAQAYREFKSAERRKKQGELGLFTINTLMYELQQRGLKMRRRFETEMQPDATTARLRPQRDYYARELTAVRMFREELKRGGKLAGLVTQHQARKLAIAASSSLQIACSPK